MDLTKKQFQILEALAMADEAISQRELEKRTGISLGTVNKTVKTLIEQGLAAEGKITRKGLDAIIKKLPNLKHTVSLLDKKHKDSKDNAAKLQQFAAEIVNG